MLLLPKPCTAHRKVSSQASGVNVSLIRASRTPGHLHKQKDKERGAGLANTSLEKLNKLHLEPCKHLSLAYGEMQGTRNNAQLSLSPLYRQTAGRQRDSRFPGSDQVASQEDCFLPPRLGWGPQSRARQSSCHRQLRWPLKTGQGKQHQWGHDLFLLRRRAAKFKLGLALVL